MAREGPIGVYGGSFDPPHICHLMACLYALAVGAARRVLVVPCHVHPFGKTLAPFDDRVTMCRLALAPLAPHVEISEIEARLDKPNYTVDTLRALAREHPGASFRLIIGSDVVKDAPRWKDFEDVRRLAPPLIVPRGGEAAAGGKNGFFLPEVSSTAIRETIRRGGDVSDVVPLPTLEHIRRRGLYVPSS